MPAEKKSRLEVQESAYLLNSWGCEKSSRNPDPKGGGSFVVVYAYESGKPSPVFPYLADFRHSEHKLFIVAANFVFHLMI